jgi:hypothetical protein
VAWEASPVREPEDNRFIEMIWMLKKAQTDTQNTTGEVACLNQTSHALEKKRVNTDIQMDQ